MKYELLGFHIQRKKATYYYIRFSSRHKKNIKTFIIIKLAPSLLYLFRFRCHLPSICAVKNIHFYDLIVRYFNNGDIQIDFSIHILDSNL